MQKKKPPACHVKPVGFKLAHVRAAVWSCTEGLPFEPSVSTTLDQAPNPTKRFFVPALAVKDKAVLFHGPRL